MSASACRMTLSLLLIGASVMLAGCAGRPSAEDYAAYETMLRAHGKLRTDTTPADAPYGARDLARNFARIALAREADPTRPGGSRNFRPSPLKRWNGPLRYRLRGGAVTEKDRAEVARLMERIGRLTGLDVAKAGTQANFLILITAPEERDALAARLARLNPRLARSFAFWRNQRQVICLADNLFSENDPYRIRGAMVVMGAETTGLLRRACLHEEVVQALGLANDHPDVRPSIFNDDGEFALLTGHDELLLRMLYDERLEPAMTAAEAVPVARRIAHELLPAGRRDRIAAAGS